MSKNIETLLAHLEKTTGHTPQFDGHEWRTCCPAHQDQGQSLSFHSTHDGRVLMDCKSGCDRDRILCAVGLPVGALLEKEPLPTPAAGASWSEISPSGIQVLLSEQKPVVTRLDQCSSAPVHWLWPGRVPLGKLTLLVGDPGLGKSLVAMDVAARVSRGLAMPQTEDEVLQTEAGEPGSVVLLSAEDDAADTIRPRLEALGGDLSRIVVLEAIDQVRFGGGSRRVSFSLESNLAALEEVMKSLEHCRLVVIDPITAYLGRTSANNHAGIRRVLAPLGTLAARHGVAVLAVNHLTKRGYGAAIYRSIGSMAFAAMARGVLGTFVDPHQQSGRILLALKNNLSAETSGIGYEVPVATGNDGAAAVPVLRWGRAPVRMTAEEILHAAARNVGSGPAVDEAAQWLASALRDGAQNAAELKTPGPSRRHPRTHAAASEGALRVVTCREGYGLHGGWLWSLPKA